MKTFKQYLIESIINDHDLLTKHYKPLYHDPKSSSLINYVGTGSYNMNNRLWTTHKGEPYHDDIDEEYIDEHIKNLHDITTSHQTPKALTVWSGTRHDPRKMMNSEGIMHHPAFLSTSLSKKTAKDFANQGSKFDFKTGVRSHHIMKIKIPKGHPGYYVGGDGGDGEHEFILPDATNLKHLHTEFSENLNGDTIHRHFIHHMEVV
jgi:hypothetical protein